MPTSSIAQTVDNTRQSDRMTSFTAQPSRVSEGVEGGWQHCGFGCGNVRLNKNDHITPFTLSKRPSLTSTSICKSLRRVLEMDDSGKAVKNRRHCINVFIRSSVFTMDICIYNSKRPLFCRPYENACIQGLMKLGFNLTILNAHRHCVLSNFYKRYFLITNKFAA